MLSCTISAALAMSSQTDRGADNRNVTVLSPNPTAHGRGLSKVCLLPKPSNHHSLSVMQGRDGLGSDVVTPQSAGYTYLGTDLDWDFRRNPGSFSFDVAFKMCSSKDQSLIIPTAYHPRRSGETKGISRMFRACPGCTETCKDQVVFSPQYVLINREATIITQCISIYSRPMTQTFESLMAGAKGKALLLKSVATLFPKCIQPIKSNF